MEDQSSLFAIFVVDTTNYNCYNTDLSEVQQLEGPTKCEQKLV